MATNKVRYISSMDNDYLLPPSAPRRYFNSMIGYFTFYLTLLAVPFAHFVFPQAPFLAPLFHLLVKHDALAFYGSKYLEEWFLAYGLNFAFTGPAAWFLMNRSTKAVSRQDYLKGNKLEDGPNVLDLLEHEWRDEERGEIALLRKGEPDLNRNVRGGAELKQDILLPNSVLELSAVVRGEVGSGKSVFLNRIIKEVIKNQHKLILHSIKGDEIGMLDGYTRRIIIAPWMDGTYAIDFLSLCVSNEEADQNARIRTLVDSFSPKKSGGDPFFENGAKSIVEAMVRCAVKVKRTNYELRVNGEDKDKFPDIGLEYIVNLWNGFNVQSDNEGEISEDSQTLIAIKEFVLTYNPTATIYIDEKSPKTSLAILASCIEVMRRFETLSGFWNKKDKNTGKIIKRPKLDMKKWISSRDLPRTIIMVNSNTHGDIADCYISAFINLTTTLLIDPSYEHGGQKIYFVLDEYPQLKSIDPDTFLKLPDVGRGKGVRVFVCAQRTAQFAYGKINGNEFCSAFPNKIWGRPASSDLSIMEDDLGKMNVLEHTVSISFNGGGKTTSRKETEKEVKVANAHDVQNELGPQKIKNRFLGVRMLFKFSNTLIVPIITMPPVSFPPRRGQQTKPKEAMAFIPNNGNASEENSTREEGKSAEVDKTTQLENDLIQHNGLAHSDLDPPTIGGEDPMIDAAKEGVAHVVDHTGTVGAMSTAIEVADSLLSDGSSNMTTEATPILTESEPAADENPTIKAMREKIAKKKNIDRNELER